MPMSMKENKSGDNLSGSVIDLFKAYYRYSTLTLAQKITIVSVSMIMFLMVFSLSLFAFLFLGIAIGIWLGRFLENPMMGFFLMSGLFMFLILLFVLFRKMIIRKLRDLIVRKVYS
jgi:hypothetical protein